MTFDEYQETHEDYLERQKEELRKEVIDELFNYYMEDGVLLFIDWRHDSELTEEEKINHTPNCYAVIKRKAVDDEYSYHLFICLNGREWFNTPNLDRFTTMVFSLIESIREKHESPVVNNLIDALFIGADYERIERGGK